MLSRYNFDPSTVHAIFECLEMGQDWHMDDSSPLLGDIYHIELVSSCFLCFIYEKYQNGWAV